MIQIGVKQKMIQGIRQKKGGAGLPEDYDCAPPLYFGLN